LAVRRERKSKKASQCGRESLYSCMRSEQVITDYMLYGKDVVVLATIICVIRFPLGWVEDNTRAPRTKGEY